MSATSAKETLLRTARIDTVSLSVAHASRPNEICIVPVVHQTPYQRSSTFDRATIPKSLRLLTGVAQTIALGMTARKCAVDRPEWTQDGDLTLLAPQDPNEENAAL